MNEKASKIKIYWDELAKTNKNEEGSTLRDSNLRELEIKTILSYLKNDTKVLLFCKKRTKPNTKTSSST